MKQDRTHYQCDRCKKSVTVPLGESPDGFWWHLQIDTLRRFKHAVMGDEGREVFLCRECAIDLDRWLRNDPKMTIVREDAEHVEFSVASPTEAPPAPLVADPEWLDRGP